MLNLLKVQTAWQPSTSWYYYVRVSNY